MAVAMTKISDIVTHKILNTITRICLLAKKIGTVGWIDLTVGQPDMVRDFYRKVVGWTETAVPMADYEDHCMNSPEDGSTQVGICKSAGKNAGMPAQWIIYITVADLTVSADEVVANGGKVLHGPRHLPNQGSYIVIEDPAGAVCALFEFESP